MVSGTLWSARSGLATAQYANGKRDAAPRKVIWEGGGTCRQRAASHQCKGLGVWDP